MDPWPYTDALGRAWHVYDFKVVQGRKRAVPINSWSAEGRAFVAIDTGAVMIYNFGLVAYHVTEPKILADQLRVAKPPRASAAERMDANR
jgi:hypothetical protein